MLFYSGAVFNAKLFQAFANCRLQSVLDRLEKEDDSSDGMSSDEESDLDHQLQNVSDESGKS